MVLGAESNEKFYHSVPTQEGVGPRVSITFRKVNTFKVKYMTPRHPNPPLLPLSQRIQSS